MIDMASVYAERFKNNPRMLQAAVMGQSPDPKLDPYTALNALRLVKEASMMAMAGKAQQPTSQPSILAETLAPPAPPQGLAGMPMGAPAGQMPPRPMPQAPVQQASGGLAGMPIPEHDYAGGGIVAFGAGDLVESDYQQETPDEGYSDSFGRPIDSEGTPDQSALQRAYAAQEAYSKFNPAEMTREEAQQIRRDYMEAMKAASGPDIYGEAQSRLKAREEARGKTKSQGEGLALLAAAGKILKGHSLAMGASEALPAFAQQMGEVQKADDQEQRSIEQMNFALADAQRKERMGDARGAQAAVETARKFQQDANKAKGDKLRYQADIASRTVGYSKTTGKGAGAGGPKLAERLADAEEAFALDPTKENRARLAALSSAASKMKTSYTTGEIGPERANAALAPVQAKLDTDVQSKLQDFKAFDPAGSEYRRAVIKKDFVTASRLLEEEEQRLRGVSKRTQAAVGGNKTPTAGTNTKIRLDKDGNILP